MKPRTMMIVGLILGAAMMRLLPHWPNVTPVIAMALFSGAAVRPAWIGRLLPLAALVLSDIVLGFHGIVPWVYGAIVMIACMGGRLKPRSRPLRIGGMAIGGSVLFFLVTNMGVWLQGGIYPTNPGGLVACYVAALPFFLNTLASTLVSAGVLFGLLHLATTQVGAPRGPTGAEDRIIAG